VKPPVLEMPSVVVEDGKLSIKLGTVKDDDVGCTAGGGEKSAQQSTTASNISNIQKW